MPRYLPSEPIKVILQTLADALDGVDFGVVLLNRDMRASFVNRRFWEIWNIDPDVLPAGPTLHELLDHAVADGKATAAYAAEWEAQVRAGSVAPTQIHFADQEHILFQCIACVNGGRLLTYVDITQEVREKTSDAMERISAELRFNVETLESQGAYLASLAEAAEENAQKAEAARLMLESEIAERRQLEVKLRRMATTDGLTGALNRAEFMALAQGEISLGSTVAVLMIDVDHFKSINDNYGHAGGDCALQKLVATLRSGIRDVDLLGRLGGEEFAVVLPNTPLDVAERVAERLRMRVMETVVAVGDRVISMTVSAGLAIQLEADRSIEPILARADDALYRAKSGGRNRVVVHQGVVAA